VNPEPTGELPTARANAAKCARSTLTRRFGADLGAALRGRRRIGFANEHGTLGKYTLPLVVTPRLSAGPACGHEH
jgi:hypothetical protein